jgi:hypothetical protein
VPWTCEGSASEPLAEVRAVLEREPRIQMRRPCWTGWGPPATGSGVGPRPDLRRLEGS